jgi:hypothetical protein
VKAPAGKLGQKPLQRGPEGRMIVLTAIEAAKAISLTPRDRVGHQSVINQPKYTDLGDRGHARPLDRKITSMGGFDLLEQLTCSLADGLPNKPDRFNENGENFTGT